VVEGARLESVCALIRRTEGSNPSLSAIFFASEAGEAEQLRDWGVADLRGDCGKGTGNHFFEKHQGFQSLELDTIAGKRVFFCLEWVLALDSVDFCLTGR
jgi:hypothetical protein